MNEKLERCPECGSRLVELDHIRPDLYGCLDCNMSFDTSEPKPIPPEITAELERLQSFLKDAGPAPGAEGFDQPRALAAARKFGLISDDEVKP